MRSEPRLTGVDQCIEVTLVDPEYSRVVSKILQTLRKCYLEQPYLFCAIDCGCLSFRFFQLLPALCSTRNRAVRNRCSTHDFFPWSKFLVQTGCISCGQERTRLAASGYPPVTLASLASERPMGAYPRWGSSPCRPALMRLVRISSLDPLTKNSRFGFLRSVPVWFFLLLLLGSSKVGL